MSLTTFTRRLIEDTSGQVLLFAAVMVVAILAFMLAIPNGTQATTQKVRGQTAADVGAFTGSVWLARALNLNANMNIGIKSVYMWETVLTMGEALAKALNTDTLDPSVRTMGQGLSLALFGSSNPVTVHSLEYPGSIRTLDSTARWLYALQDDIAASFGDLAATLGSEEASRNAGAYPASQSAGGRVLIRTNDTLPFLEASAGGDSLVYDNLLQLGAGLESIPTNDSNIGPATGIIKIDSTSYEVKAYYGSISKWFTLTQGLIQGGQTRVNQWYAVAPATPDSQNHVYSAHRYFKDFKDKNIQRSTGKSWLGSGVDLWFIDSLKGRTDWRVYGKKSFSVPHPGDTQWVHQTHWKLYTDSGWGPVPPGDTADSTRPWLDSGWTIVMSGAFNTDFFAGAESTTGYQGPKVRIRRVNPAREFDAVAYAWRQGASASPWGLGAPMGGRLFPRSSVAAPSPMLTVAESELYLARANPTEYDYYFSPAWDVRLTPLDSVGVLRIVNDTEFGGHSRNAFNLEELRKYALLP